MADLHHAASIRHDLTALVVAGQTASMCSANHTAASLQGISHLVEVPRTDTHWSTSLPSDARIRNGPWNYPQDDLQAVAHQRHQWLRLKRRS